LLTISSCAPEAGPVPGGRPARGGAPGRSAPPAPSSLPLLIPLLPPPPHHVAPPPLLILSLHSPFACLATPPLPAPRAPTNPAGFNIPSTVFHLVAFPASHALHSIQALDCRQHPLHRPPRVHLALTPRPPCTFRWGTRTTARGWPRRRAGCAPTAWTPPPASACTWLGRGRYCEEHVIECHLTQETRVQSQLDKVASSICSPCHRVPFNSRNEGSKCVGCSDEQCLLAT